MVSEAKHQIVVWSAQIQKLAGRSFHEMDPQTYSIGAVFVICVGFVLLSGKR